MPSLNLENFFKQLVANASEVANVLTVGKKPQLSYSEHKAFNNEEVASTLKKGYVFYGKYSGNFNGLIYILLPENLALRFAGLLMGVGISQALGAAEKSAVFELMNNVMGRWVTLWSQVTGSEVKISEQELYDKDKEISVQEENWLSVSVDCAIDGDKFEFNIFIPGDDVDIIQGETEPVVDQAQEEKMTEIEKPKDTPAKMKPAEDSAEPASKHGEKPTVESRESEPAVTTSQASASVRKASFQQLGDEAKQDVSDRPIELILDVPLLVSVELGRKDLTIKDILELAPGSIIELDQLAGEPVDLMVNGKLFARGEVVVIDENFGVRVTNIISPQERLEKMR